MIKRFSWLLFLCLIYMLWSGFGCSDHPIPETPNSGIYTANLNKGPTIEFENIRRLFTTNNPGYDIKYAHDIRMLDSKNFPRVGFIQEGGGTVKLTNRFSSKFSVGDLIMIPDGVEVRTDSQFSCLLFKVPEEWDGQIPFIIRPDWDDKITDVPGGCATETNAYRRILLTWKEEVGPYVYHALNTHRVRISDSFTHYHPEEGGFDEFYLVQMARPNARIITSPHLETITHPEQVTPDQVESLLHTTDLNVGDLIYIPRGIIHRGIDSVLAQVITIPGFIPGAEIGVDHHINEINEYLSLEHDQRLPFNEEASTSPVVR